MNLIEYNPGNLTHNFRSTVKHGPQNLTRETSVIGEDLSLGTDFSCHNKAGRGGVDGDISCHEAHIAELGEHFSIFLITERLKRLNMVKTRIQPISHLDGARVNYALLVTKALRDSIFGDDGFAGACMS